MQFILIKSGKMAQLCQLLVSQQGLMDLLSSASDFLSAIFCLFSVMRIPLPTFHSFRTNPSHVLLYPTGSKLKLSLTLLIRLLKLSDRLLTPSSSTRPAHSVLWDEL